MNFKHTYSANIFHEKIAMLGIYPPPLGGVSVHVKRVIDTLRLQKNIVNFFNTEPRYRYKLFYFYVMHLFFWVLIKRPDRLFYHSSALKNSLNELRVLVLLKRIVKFKLILIEHNCRHLYKRDENFMYAFKKKLKHIDHLVLIGNVTYLSYKTHDLLGCFHTIEGAFLSPKLSEKKIILHTYPKNLFVFTKIHTPIILVNAFQLVLLDDDDLYGIDLSIRMIKNIKNKFPNVGLIIALAKIGNQKYLYELESKIKNFSLQSHIFFLHGQKELWPLFNYVDIFVRPTLSDGASVSVQEALYFGVPVVASDVCMRPDKTFVFKKNNEKNFTHVMLNVLKTHNLNVEL